MKVPPANLESIEYATHGFKQECLKVRSQLEGLTLSLCGVVVAHSARLANGGLGSNPSGGQCFSQKLAAHFQTFLLKTMRCIFYTS